MRTKEDELTLGDISSAASAYAENARRCERAAQDLGIVPDVHVDDEAFVAVTWFKRTVNGATLEVVTTWGPNSPEVSTVIATYGGWCDEFTSVAELIDALEAADQLLQQVLERV